MVDDIRHNLSLHYYRTIVIMREFETENDECRRRELQEEADHHQKMIMEIEIRRNNPGKTVSDLDRLRYIVEREEFLVGGSIDGGAKLAQLNELSHSIRHHLPMPSSTRRRKPGIRDRDTQSADRRPGSGNRNFEAEITDLHARMIWAYAHQVPFGVWNPNEQVDAADKFMKRVVEVAASWRALRPEVQYEFGRAEPEDVDDDEDDDDQASIWELIDRLEAKAKLGHGPATAKAREGHPRHSKNLQAIAVAETCGTVWRHRTGKPAPGGEVKEHPFGDFLQDVFDDLGIGGSVRVATKNRGKTARP